MMREACASERSDPAGNSASGTFGAKQIDSDAGTERPQPLNADPRGTHNMSKATPAAGRGLLTPDNHTLIMIDHQPQMAFATKSIDAVELRNNTALVAKAAQIFAVSHILTTVAAKTFSGPIFPEILAAFPNDDTIDRTTMNTWEDPRISDA